MEAKKTLIMQIEKFNFSQAKPSQKLIAGGLLLGGGFLFLKFALPVLISMMINIWLGLLIGVPLAFIGIYVVKNPMFIWQGFENLSVKLTKRWISADKIGFLQRGYEYMENRYKFLESLIIDYKSNIKAKALRIEKIRQSMNENLHLANEADLQINQAEGEKQQQLIIARDIAITKAENDRVRLEKLIPQLEENLNDEAELKKIANICKKKLEQKKHQIEGLIEDHIDAKNSHSVHNQAKEFLTDRTQNNKIMDEAIKQIETDIHEFSSFSEEFTRQSQPMLTTSEIESSLVIEQGRKLLESYRNNQKQIQEQKQPILLKQAS